jgi:hypothetical protein
MMQKTIVFLSLFLFISTFSTAQNENVISITTNFFKGDTIKYHIEEGKKTYLNDKVKDSTFSERKMTLVVVDSTEKGFLIDIEMSYDKKSEELLKDFLKNESNADFYTLIKISNYSTESLRRAFFKVLRI